MTGENMSYVESVQRAIDYIEEHLDQELDLQPMIRLVQVDDPANLQPMHWSLDDRPKHALELHSKNIGLLKERVLENGGAVSGQLQAETGTGAKALHQQSKSEVLTQVLEDMKPHIVEHSELKLIGIPCISLKDMNGKYQHAKEALLSSTKHWPSVKNASVHYGIWPEVSTQQQSDMHAYILCVEVDSFVDVPEWYFRTILPPQKCIVVPNKSGDFKAAGHSIDQYISDHRIQVGANDRKYVICERYNYEREGFARYSLPIQNIPGGLTMYIRSIRKEPPGGYRPVMVPKALKMINGGKAVNKQHQSEEGFIRRSPIKNKVGSIFVPVRDIEKSRSWYCRVLGLEEAECKISFGHLCTLPMEGTGIILDTMPKWGGDQPGGAPSIETPAFMLMTDDLQSSLDYMKELGVELVTEIEHNHWFVVKDPDGNKLMICRE